MSLKLYFNPKAWEALAKELRRGSWSVSVLLGIGGYNLDQAWILLFAGLSWAILQIAALMLESVKNERR